MKHNFWTKITKENNSFYFPNTTKKKKKKKNQQIKATMLKGFNIYIGACLERSWNGFNI